jgi:hypothetical protein
MTHFDDTPKPDDPFFFALLAGSFARLVGRPLVPEQLGAACAVWLYGEAPFVEVAHNTDPDPRFVYANRTAQACFGYGWDEFVTLPSRLSAAAELQEKRQAVLDAVARKGFVAGYGGIRVARSGRRFRISDAVIWQLIDEAGVVRGQAATFAEWEDV